MTPAVQRDLEHFMHGLEKRNPHEDEFHQAVHEVAASVLPFIEDHKKYKEEQILERLTEPDRIIIFRVCWEDDDGNVRVNRAWRVQFNNALGPYKGGLRFHPSVTQSVLKFLGFEQIFKNSLTGLPMGGAKGGSNFNPKEKSKREVMRFCQSLMIELRRHIGEDTDVPAGDIGVGGREISFMFGQFLRTENRWTGAITGKGQTFGGSEVRIEATGYGCVYFCRNMLEEHEEGIEGKTVAISGAGNVAIYAAEKAMQLGAKVVTLSDSGGFIHVTDGFNEELLEEIKELKEEKRGRLSELSDKQGVEYHEGAKPWGVKCDVALPCATQNEIGGEEAKQLVGHKVMAVCEGANMPCDADAVEIFRENDILFAPGKAANAGGVAVSGLEQSQNAMRITWPRDEVDRRLQTIMDDIHAKCVKHGFRPGKHVDYLDGANIAGFKRVADAMLAYGVI